MKTITKWIAGPAIAFALVTFGNADTASAQGFSLNVGGYGWGINTGTGFNRGYSGFQRGYRSAYAAPTFRTNQRYRVSPGYGYHPPYPHYDYHPTQVYRHGNHYDVIPGHYDLHIGRRGCGRYGHYGY